MNVPLRVAAFWLAYAALFLGLGLVLVLVPPAGRMLVAGVLITTATMALTVVFTRSERLTRGTSNQRIGCRHEVKWTGSRRHHLQLGLRIIAGSANE